MTVERKRWLWAALAVILVIAAAAIWTLTGSSGNDVYVPLFSYELNPNQLQEVEAFLKDKDFDFKVEEGQVQVPEGKHNDILVELAKAGIPSTK